MLTNDPLNNKTIFINGIEVPMPCRPVYHAGNVDFALLLNFNSSEKRENFKKVFCLAIGQTNAHDG